MPCKEQSFLLLCFMWINLWMNECLNMPRLKKHYDILLYVNGYGFYLELLSETYSGLRKWPTWLSGFPDTIWMYLWRGPVWTVKPPVALCTKFYSHLNKTFQIRCIAINHAHHQVSISIPNWKSQFWRFHSCHVLLFFLEVNNPGGH